MRRKATARFPHSGAPRHLRPHGGCVRGTGGAAARWRSRSHLFVPVCTRHLAWDHCSGDACCRFWRQQPPQQSPRDDSSHGALRRAAWAARHALCVCQRTGLFPCGQQPARWVSHRAGGAFFLAARESRSDVPLAGTVARDLSAALSAPAAPPHPIQPALACSGSSVRTPAARRSATGSVWWWLRCAARVLSSGLLDRVEWHERAVGVPTPSVGLRLVPAVTVRTLPGVRTRLIGRHVSSLGLRRGAIPLGPQLKHCRSGLRASGVRSGGPTLVVASPAASAGSRETCPRESGGASSPRGAHHLSGLPG